MKNTILQNVISNFDLMDKQHFLDWFQENKEWMLEKEKEQIIKANRDGVDMCVEHSKFLTGKEYYEKTFKN